MILDRVTMTGADDSVSPRDLLPLSEKFHFVEWGILFSQKQQGNPRYPSNGWITDLSMLERETVQSNMEGASFHNQLGLCAHLCGKWVRDIVLQAEPSWWGTYAPYASMFKRVQLNFHGQFHQAHALFDVALRNAPLKRHEFILQHDGVNDETILNLGSKCAVFPLFDRSGGAGVVPGEWPKPIWKYQGYAGGLGPENVVDELKKIQDVVGDSRIWIDMETRIRSDEDKQFDLAKVEKVLELVAPFVKASQDA